VHCTGGGSTQAGLLAGFAALGIDTPVTGILDDAERDAKRELVLRLANATLDALGLPQRVADSQVEIVIADPVYEGRTIRGQMDLIVDGALRPGERVLVLHLGGTPAVHGYANQLSQDGLVPLPFTTTATHR
jgi:1-aminocyclopropane-1-carboxylate deaminase/D-cysteine desulfhydrase-like pyridoxal-dependent ACC family enzyme